MSDDPSVSELWPEKGFIDLCSKPASTEEALAMLPLYRDLGYTLVAMERAPFLETHKIESSARNLGIGLAWRVTIRASRPREVQNRVREVARRGRPHVIAVTPQSVDAGRYAARSKNVDIIAIEPGMERLVDHSTSTLFSQRGWGAIEIHIAPLLGSAGGPERRLEAMLRHFFLVARKAIGYRIPLVASSCAETRWELVHPYHVVGIAVVPGVPPEESLSWMTSVPRSILARHYPGKK